MKKIICPLSFALIVYCILIIDQCHAQTVPVISNLTYGNISQTGVTLFWKTDIPSDSKILWMAPDSNYQPLVFTDSLYNSNLVTSHELAVGSLQPAKIYKYQVFSKNSGGTAVDSGYFVTQSASTGLVEVYFNHSVDTTVSNGESANGDEILINKNTYNKTI